MFASSSRSYKIIIIATPRNMETKRSGFLMSRQSNKKWSDFKLWNVIAMQQCVCLSLCFCRWHVNSCSKGVLILPLLSENCNLPHGTC